MSGPDIDDLVAFLIEEKNYHSLEQLPQFPGIYGLKDHRGKLRYVGITLMTIRKRVHGYHVAGDGNSHKYSSAYNAGLLWEDRKSPYSVKANGIVAKSARREFCRRTCTATGYPLPMQNKSKLEEIETLVISRIKGLDWNGKRQIPTEDVDDLIWTVLPEISASDKERMLLQKEAWKSHTSMR